MRLYAIGLFQRCDHMCCLDHPSLSPHASSPTRPAPTQLTAAGADLPPDLAAATAPLLAAARAHLGGALEAVARAVPAGGAIVVDELRALSTAVDGCVAACVRARRLTEGNRRRCVAF